MPSKMCSRCQQVKPKASFSYGGGADGLHSYCMTCQREYSSAYNAKKREAKDAEKAAHNALIKPMTDEAKAAILDFFGVIKIDGVML